MLGSLKRRVAVATAVGLLGMTGSALAAGSASAAVYHLNYQSSSGTAVAVNTPYTATSSNIALTSTSSPFGAVVTCTSSTLSGVTTTITGATSGSPAAGLNVTGGSFGGCKINASGLSVTVTGSYSPAWLIIPTGGTTSPFTGTVSNVSATIACGSGNSATFTGTLGNGGAENNATPASNITLTHATSLTKSSSSGTGCALPSTVDVTGTYTLATVNGAAITSNGSNNFWLSYS